jgi:hypothetical protein
VGAKWGHSLGPVQQRAEGFRRPGRVAPMVILIPWRPIVLIWLLLSAMLWCGYVGSSLTEGKNPFAPYTLQGLHGRHSSRSVRHQAYSRDAKSTAEFNPRSASTRCLAVRRPSFLWSPAANVRLAGTDWSPIHHPRATGGPKEYEALRLTTRTGALSVPAICAAR